jgi:OmpA-OmpF porin, OOP family
MGVVVAVTTRHGRSHTVARELLRAVEGETALFGASPSAAPVPDISEALTAPSAAASGLSQRLRITKIYCRIRGRGVGWCPASHHARRVSAKLWENLLPIPTRRSRPMRGFALPIAIALALAASVAAAQEPADGKVPADKIEQQLTPAPGTPMLTPRGLRVLDKSAAEQQKQMPASRLDIKFKVNSAVLTDQGKDQIKELAQAINSEGLTKYSFRIEGHTDSTGRPEHNMVLSKRRAEAVKDYLVSAYNVPKKRLRVVGRGQNDPISGSAPTDPANRRVEVINIGP